MTLYALLVLALLGLVIVGWMRFLSYWAQQEVKNQEQRQQELIRALELTHDLSKRGPKGFHR